MNRHMRSLGCILLCTAYALAENPNYEEYLTQSDVSAADAVSPEIKERIRTILSSELSDVLTADLQALNSEYQSNPGVISYLRVLAADTSQTTTTRERATIWVGISKSDESMSFLLSQLATLRTQAEPAPSEESTEFREDTNIRVLLGATIIGLTRAGRPESGAEIRKAVEVEYWSKARVISEAGVQHLRRLALEALAQSGSAEATEYFTLNSNRPSDIEPEEKWLKRAARAIQRKAEVDQNKSADKGPGN